MYNMIFGRNPLAPVLLAILNLTEDDFGRFRDAFAIKNRTTWEGAVLASGPFIAVYTRCGGGNRPAYEEMYARMKKHPNYAGNEDDDFDNTYATIYFTVPEKYKEALVFEGDDFNTSQRWSNFLSRLEKGEATEQEKENMKPLITILKDILGE